MTLDSNYTLTHIVGFTKILFLVEFLGVFVFLIVPAFVLSQPI
jgi:hypothetical protein